MNSFKDWLGEHGLPILIIVIITWIALQFGMRIIRQVIRRTVKYDHDIDSERAFEMREKTLTRIIGSIYKVVVLGIGGLLVLSELGVNTAPLFAGAGIVSLAIGFGAQDLVKDVVAGIFILFENQYRVGDVVELAGYTGTVEKMTLRVTVVRSLDGDVHYIPNGSIDQSTNKTLSYSRINLDVGVAYGSDIDKVEKLINKLGEQMAEDEVWGNDILEKPHMLRISDLADSSIEIKVVGKTKPERQWAVAGELRRRLVKEFDKQGVEIPFPQVVVHKSI
jgi:small-conductance mechanosensitive channel